MVLHGLKSHLKIIFELLESSRSRSAALSAGRCLSWLPSGPARTSRDKYSELNPDTAQVFMIIQSTIQGVCES